MHAHSVRLAALSCMLRDIKISMWMYTFFSKMSPIFDLKSEMGLILSQSLYYCQKTCDIIISKAVGKGITANACLNMLIADFVRENKAAIE